MKKAFSFIIILTLLLSLGVSAFAVSRNLVVGENVNAGLYTVSGGELITSVSHSGVLPDGLYLQVDDSRQTVSFIGSPTSPGTYSFTLNIDVSTTDGQSYTRMVDVNGTISSNSVIITAYPMVSTYPVTTPTATVSTFTVTKQPGAENRTAGGYAIFIAKASGASDATWTLVAPDGGQYSVDTFKTKFPSIYVTVKNEITDDVLTSTITLNDVSTDVSGYSAFATFTNASGTMIKTNSAAMTITAATPTPTATVKATTTPTPVPTVAPTTKPVATVAPTSSLSTTSSESGTSASASPVPTDSPQSASHASDNTEVINHKSSNVGIIIITVIIGLLTIAIAVVLILYVQGKLDLSWLENKLENRHHHHRDDD